ncbi:MAG: ester cyclase [Granulosicoccus sp.]|nr:ester cyclase [Granulosicoccus sp.]
MPELQNAKAIVREANTALDAANPTQTAAVLRKYTSPEYRWRGMHPFNEQTGAETVAELFWVPLKNAFGPLQRRADIFLCGLNQLDNWQSTWVVEMGHLMGLWDNAWIGLAPSHKIALLRYVEFHRVENDKIAETACYIDIINLLAQVGRSPLPPGTGVEGLTPGPRTHAGLLYDTSDQVEGLKTVQLIADMVEDLRAHTVHSPSEHMDRFWTPDMCWFGPGGIGSSAFFEGYRRGHSGPFEDGLEYVKHAEHVARLGEGLFGGFFGYPSLTMRSTGGFMGLPKSDVPADMRIVDLYRRDGDKLAENWIFIDIPHFCAMQGIDLLS